MIACYLSFTPSSLKSFWQEHFYPRESKSSCVGITETTVVHEHAACCSTSCKRINHIIARVQLVWSHRRSTTGAFFTEPTPLDSGARREAPTGTMRRKPSIAFVNSCEETGALPSVTRTASRGRRRGDVADPTRCFQTQRGAGQGDRSHQFGFTSSKSRWWRREVLVWPRREVNLSQMRHVWDWHIDRPIDPFSINQPPKRLYGFIPRHSMYAIYAYIDPQNHPNVGKYTIHGVSGICQSQTGRVSVW